MQQTTSTDIRRTDSTQDVVTQTADADLLQKPLRGIVDVEAIEQIPLDERLRVVDISHRVAYGLASRKPGDTAIFYVPDGDVKRPAVEISFRDLKHKIDQTAALLRTRGIGQTDVVAILLPGVPDIYWSILGTISAAIAFPVNWMLEPEHLLRLLREAEVKAVIALGPTPGFSIWESLEQIAKDLSPNILIFSVAGPQGERLPDSDLDRCIENCHDQAGTFPARSGDDVAVYLHSGGTTGLPKIIKLSHRNASYRHWTLQLAYKATVGEVILHDAPMFHSGGLMGRCIPPLASGASMLIPSVMGARDKSYLSNYWKFVEKYRVSRLSGVPTTLAVLNRNPPQGENLSSLKPYFITGSTAIPIPVRNRFEEISGVRVLNSYGMTENTASIAVEPRDGSRKDGSSGIRLPYTQVRAVIARPGQTMRLCDPDELGILHLKGPGVSPAYLNPSHDRLGRTDDGWLITGDIGRIDSDGHIFVTGRAKDVIIRGGHNIDPLWIEEPLLRHPEVMHAAAVGKPDSHAGEVPVLFVQLVNGASVTTEELSAFLKDRVPERAALPKELYLVDKLPLTDVGKPDKVALREQVIVAAFEAILGEAAGYSSKTGQLTVSVHPDPQRGTKLHIALHALKNEGRHDIATRIDNAMGHFAMPYELFWEDGDA
jgi:fatty-acyl-CoA synthase